MAFGAAVGGPGPTSLAYRTSLRSLATWRLRASSLSTRLPYPSSSYYSSSRAVESTQVFPDFEASTPSPSRRSKAGRSTSKPSWKKTRSFDNSNVKTSPRIRSTASVVDSAQTGADPPSQWSPLNIRPPEPHISTIFPSPDVQATSDGTSHQRQPRDRHDSAIRDDSNPARESPPAGKAPIISFVFPKPPEFEVEDGKTYMRPFDKRFGVPPVASVEPPQVTTIDSLISPPPEPRTSPIHHRKIRKFSEGILRRLAASVMAARTPVSASRQLDSLAIAFWQMYSPDAKEKVASDIWRTMSVAISKVYRSTDGKRELMVHVIKRGYHYELLRDMAIEVAAASDNWEGLFHLALAFLRERKPEEVIRLWYQYRTRIYEAHGKSLAALSSWDRETRLNSRITLVGMKPMNRVCIAAATAHNIMTSAIVRLIANSMRGLSGETGGSWTGEQIRDIIRSYPNGSELQSKVESNWKVLFFAGSFEHSRAAEQLIREQSLSSEKALLEVYHWIIEQASGPDPLLRAAPWKETMIGFEAEHGSPDTTFLLVRKIWGALTKAFISRGLTTHLVKLYTQDLPALNIHPTPGAIGDIVLKLTTFLRVERPASIVAKVQEAIETFKKLHAERRDGSTMGDDAVQAATLNDSSLDVLLDYLSRMSLTKGRFCGNRTRTELLMQLIYHRKFEACIEVLGWPECPQSEDYVDYKDERFTRTEPSYWTSVVRALAKLYDKDPVDADQKLKAALAHAPPAENRSIMFESAIAAHHILMGRDIQDSLATVFKALNDPSNRTPEWQRATAIIMTQRTGKSLRVNERLADAAFRIVETYFITRPKPYFSEMGAMRLVTSYTTLIATASRINSEQRMTFILRTLALARTAFDMSYRHSRIWTWVIKEVLFRDDNDSLPEALEIWRDLEKVKSHSMPMFILHNDFPTSNAKCQLFVSQVIVSTYVKSGNLPGPAFFWNDPRTKAILRTSGSLKGRSKSKFMMAVGKAEPEPIVEVDGSSADSDPDYGVDATDDLLEEYGELPEGPKNDTTATASTDPNASSAPPLAPVLSAVSLDAIPNTAPSQL